MTTPSASDIDIFATPARKEEPVRSNDPPRESVKAMPKKSMNAATDTLKPWHFAIAILVAAAIWIFWPMVMRPNERPSQPQQFSVPVVETAPDYAQSRPVKEVAAQEPVVSEIQQQQAQQQELLQGQVKTLAGTTVELQSQVRELQAKLAVLEARPQPAAPKPRAAAAQRTRLPAAASTSTAEVAKPLAGYSLNTVYTDQAWLQHDQSTVVVQVGDIIDGMRIVRIDPVARQVVTNLGVIR